MRNTKNYTVNRGAKTVIGGEIEITGTLDIENATITPVIENQAASVAATVSATVADLNALISKLKASGLMEADEVAEDDEAVDG